MQKTKKSDYMKMFAVCMLVAAVMTGIWLLIAALLLQKMGLNEKQVQILIYVIYVTVSFMAGIIAGKWQKEKKFLWGTLAGGIYFCVILLLSFLLQGFTADIQAFFPALLYMLGGGMLGGMLA